jgi:site-specific DNA recombinase
MGYTSSLCRIFIECIKVRPMFGRKEISEEIPKLNAKLANARDMLFDEKLDHDDYKIMKRECEEKLKRLEIALTEVKVQNSNQLNIDNMILKAIEALSKLNELFLEGDILTKREVLGSIFREKLGFDGCNYRTARISEPAKLSCSLYLNIREFTINKHGYTTVERKYQFNFLTY